MIKDSMKTGALIFLLVCVLLVVGKETNEIESDVQIEINDDDSTTESKKDPPPQSTQEDDDDPSIDDYPEHEPIMQPFDQDYEEEQEGEQKKKEEKIAKPSNSEAEGKTPENEPTMRSYGKLFEDEFKTPEILLDGMADHEPIYQPEDPGDDNDINFPFHNEVNDKETTTHAATENIETNQIGGDQQLNKKQYDFEEQFDINDHEPVYQPEDPGESHDEL